MERRYSLEFAFGLRNLHERETPSVWPRRVVSGPSLLLFHVSKRPSSSFYRRRSTDTEEKEREREREPSLHFSSDASERLEIDKRPFHPAR